MSTNEITTKVRKMKRLQARAEALQTEITAIHRALYDALYQQFVKLTTSRRFSVA